MSIPSPLPESATLRELFIAFPKTAKPLLEYHQALLREDSPLSVAERELIAAYVSGLNECHYCHGIHAKTAAAFGIKEALLLHLVEDLESAEIEPKMRVLLGYLKHLTLSPSSVTENERVAVYDAGWSLDALHDAVSVCALFNFMNRLVMGMGITGETTLWSERGALLHQVGYKGLMELLEL